MFNLLVCIMMDTSKNRIVFYHRERERCMLFNNIPNAHFEAEVH